jgi:hypothetical protein
VIEDIRREHVMNAFRAACAIALSFLPAVAGASDTDWRRYVLPKSGAAVEVPVTIFGKQAELPEGGLGWRFTTGDGRADLTVQAFPNSANDSPAGFLAKMRPPSGVLYKRVTPSFFVVSSFRNDRIWYNRCNRAGGAGGYMNCILINYPAAEKRRWDGTVTRISHSLAEQTAAE